MCLVLLARDIHPQYRTIIAANRDEFYERPTDPLAPWADRPSVLAGRDLSSGGTWMGVTRGGRFGAVTNFRDPANKVSGAPSRGGLVSGFLVSKSSATDYVESIRVEAGTFNGFNLLTDDGDETVWFSNRGDDPIKLVSGLYGLSNNLIDVPWPKVEKAKRGFKDTLQFSGDDLVQSLLALLGDREAPPDETLPETGIGIDWERILSPIFITSPVYGTRSSSVVLIDREGVVTFVEQIFEKGSAQEPPRSYSFSID
ncbi:MAG: NRDE family protein [Deltaproteobacteria bacterium]|nr:NRDE family protein [Deltaproteobacteria bacterium]